VGTTSRNNPREMLIRARTSAPRPAIIWYNSQIMRFVLREPSGNLWGRLKIRTRNWSCVLLQCFFGFRWKFHFQYFSIFRNQRLQKTQCIVGLILVESWVKDGSRIHHVHVNFKWCCKHKKCHQGLSNNHEILKFYSTLKVSLLAIKVAILD